MICDVVSMIITAIALELGVHSQLAKEKLNIQEIPNAAIIATSIMLLLNLSDVLKSIVETGINIGTFFKINVVKF